MITSHEIPETERSSESIDHSVICWLIEIWQSNLNEVYLTYLPSILEWGHENEMIYMYRYQYHFEMLIKIELM